MQSKEKVLPSWGGHLFPFWILVKWYLTEDQRVPGQYFLQLWEPPLRFPIWKTAQDLGSILLDLSLCLGYEFPRWVAPTYLFAPVYIPGGSQFLGVHSPGTVKWKLFVLTAGKRSTVGLHLKCWQTSLKIAGSSL